MSEVIKTNSQGASDGICYAVSVLKFCTWRGQSRIVNLRWTGPESPSSPFHKTYNCSGIAFNYFIYAKTLACMLWVFLCTCQVSTFLFLLNSFSHTRFFRKIQFQIQKINIHKL